jgi:hypothetical protein
VFAEDAARNEKGADGKADDEGVEPEHDASVD